MSGCIAPSHWKFESLDTGDPLFDSARLTYVEPATPLRFEIVRLHSGLETFLSLTQYTFTQKNEVKLILEIDGEAIEETVPLLEGSMRLRLPPQFSERLILALQDGKEVAILVDGFEERLNPDRFAHEYKKLAGKALSFRSPFKGLFDP